MTFFYIHWERDARFKLQRLIDLHLLKLIKIRKMLAVLYVDPVFSFLIHTIWYNNSKTRMCLSFSGYNIIFISHEGIAGLLLESIIAKLRLIGELRTLIFQQVNEHIQLMKSSPAPLRSQISAATVVTQPAGITKNYVAERPNKSINTKKTHPHSSEVAEIITFEPSIRCKGGQRFTNLWLCLKKKKTKKTIVTISEKCPST